jgi:peptide-methionine (S)-S-oxide reductase
METLGILTIVLSLNLYAQKQINPLDSMNQQQNIEIATLGSGCFWCSEAIYEGLKGVVSVQSGYSGGFVKNPSYREVCNGTTSHAEVVQIRFDPSIISYKYILEVFFHTHDPTSLNQQGADIGTQYRSVIFYHSNNQKDIANEVIKNLTSDHTYSKPIVTEVSPFSAFYIAEEYHQDYFAKNPNAAYCNYVIRPKIDKFQKNYSKQLK